MKAVVVYEKGGSDQLIYQDVEKPKLKEGHSLVKIKSFGINRSEIFTRQGKSPTVKFPRILGIECTGVIEESERFEKNQKVISMMGGMGRVFDGSYAEYALIPNNQIYTFDMDLDWKTLGAVPETFFTAFGSMKNLKIQEDDSILIRGGTSGVAIAFIKLIKAQYPNIYIAGSTRHESKIDKMKSYGYDDVLIDKNNLLLTDKSFNKIFELIGPLTLIDSIMHLEENGILCSTGQLGGKWALEEFDPIQVLNKNTYLTSFYSGSVNQEKVDEMFSYIKTYNVDVKPEKVFKLSEIKKAHDYLESTDSFGKVVITT